MAEVWLRMSLHVDRLLANGPTPPPVALELTAAAAAYLSRAGPVGATALTPARIRLSEELALEFDEAEPGATTADDARALGGLLFHLLTAAPLRAEEVARATQMAELATTLEPWPSGAEVHAFVAELLATGPGRVSFGEVCKRCDALRARLPSMHMRVWAREQLGTPVPADMPPPNADIPDQTTGMYPVGMLADQLGQAPSSSRHDSLTSLSDFVPPEPSAQPAGDDDVSGVLRALKANAGRSLYRPSQSPAPMHVRPARRAGASGSPWPWVASAVLLSISALLLVYLLL